MRLSFDCMVSILQSLDDKDYRYKEAVRRGRFALSENSTLLKCGLVECYQKRDKDRNYPGRSRKAYRLTQPYDTIQVNQLVTDMFPLSDFDKRVLSQLGNIRLALLDDIDLPDMSALVVPYSAERLIACLGCLSLSSYIPLHPALYNVSYDPRRIMNDMAAIGVVDILAVRTREYRLSRPLSEVSIAALLPYLWSFSVHRQYYNRLLYAMQDYPVSRLVCHKVGG